MCYFLKKLAYFLTVFIVFCVYKQYGSMNAKISVFVICVEAITYLVLYNLHDCAFNAAN